MGQIAHRPHLHEFHGRGRRALAWRVGRSLALVGLAVALLGAQTPPLPEAKPPTPFSGKAAYELLKAQTDFGPRYPGSEAQIKTRDWIVEALKPNVDEVTIQPFTHRWSQGGKRLEMYNVLGSVNWEKAETRVLLLAHWDTRPTADMEYRDEDRYKPILGANDGASGVAVLLELARALKEKPIPGLGVQFLFVDGEDLGPGVDEMFLGARHYAGRLPEKRPHYGILLDMIGDADLQVPMEPNSMNAAPRLMTALYRHAEQVGLGRTFPRMMGPQISDDHLPLIAAGVPTIDLIDFSYPHWHTLQDTPDKCSAQSLGKVGLLLESWLRKNPTFRKPR